MRNIKMNHIFFSYNIYVPLCNYGLSTFQKAQDDSLSHLHLFISIANKIQVPQFYLLSGKHELQTCEIENEEMGGDQTLINSILSSTDINKIWMRD